MSSSIKECLSILRPFQLFLRPLEELLYPIRFYSCLYNCHFSTKKISCSSWQHSGAEAAKECESVGLNFWEGWICSQWQIVWFIQVWKDKWRSHSLTAAQKQRYQEQTQKLNWVHWCKVTKCIYLSRVFTYVHFSMSMLSWFIPLNFQLKICSSALHFLTAIVVLFRLRFYIKNIKLAFETEYIVNDPTSGSQRLAWDPFDHRQQGLPRPSWLLWGSCNHLDLTLKLGTTGPN